MSIFIRFILGLQDIMSEPDFSQVLFFHTYQVTYMGIFAAKITFTKLINIMWWEDEPTSTPLRDTSPCKNCPHTTSVLISTKPLNSLMIMRKRLANSHSTWLWTNISLGILRVTICEFRLSSSLLTMVFILTKISHCLICAILTPVNLINTHYICL